MVDVKKYFFKIKFYAAVLIDIAYMFSCGWMTYHEIVDGVNDLPFYMCFEFYVHLSVLLFFCGCFIQGMKLYLSGDNGSVKMLLLPFYAIFSFFIPSKQTVGELFIVGLLFLVLFAIWWLFF